MAIVSDEALDEPLDPLSEQALAWLVQLHSGAASEADWLAYDQWCQASSAQQAAALRAERLWSGLGSALQRPRRKGPRAALFGLVLAIATTAGLGLSGQQQGWMANQRTGVGERRQVHLADGSVLDLAPQTRLDIDLRPDQRTLRLYSGELHVQVAADPSRPFVVQAGAGDMRALGTGFDVRREGGQVRLVVTEHSVRARVALASGSEQADVQVGEGFDYDGQRVRGPYPVDARAVTAWRRDRLIFDGQPLGEVLRALSRYHSGLLLVLDDELKRLPVTGIFDTADLDAQLALLAQSLPIRVRHLPWLTLVEPGADVRSRE